MGRPIELPSPWRELAEAFGGVRLLAQACDVRAWTIQRWARGDFVPSTLTRRAVNLLATRRGLERPFPSEE